MTKEEIFVLKDKFYRDLIRTAPKNSEPKAVSLFLWKGKKIHARNALLNHCIFNAEMEIKNSEEYIGKLMRKSCDIFKQFKWVKDKKKYSRCGKWLLKMKEGK